MNEIADCIEHNMDAVRENIVKMVAGIPAEVDLQCYSTAELRLDTRIEGVLKKEYNFQRETAGRKQNFPERNHLFSDRKSVV